MHRPDASSPEQGSRTEFLQFAMQLDELAYIRRAKGVESAWESLLSAFAARRNEMLAVSWPRLAVLDALVDRDWRRVEPLVEDPNELTTLARMLSDSGHVLRAPVSPTHSLRRLRRALQDIAVSIDRFNRHWKQFVRDYDLGPINRQRQDYNKYYPIEKACAFACERIGFHGFEPLPDIDAADILLRFPTLWVPRLRPASWKIIPSGAGAATAAARKSRPRTVSSNARRGVDE